MQFFGKFTFNLAIKKHKPQRSFPTNGLPRCNHVNTGHKLFWRENEKIILKIS